MGQYYKLVNETKKEVISPHRIDCTAKFYEWLWNNQARVLVWLLRKSDEGGGGDIDDADSYETLGRWAGDKIVLIGDYDSSRLYQKSEEYTDISKKLVEEYNKGCDLTDCQIRN